MQRGPFPIGAALPMIRLKTNGRVMSSNEDIVKAFNAAWAAGDIDGAMAHVDDDAVYALYLSNEILPFAGETIGRAGIAAALREVRRQFDYLVYRPHGVVVSGEMVRMRVEHIYRHRASGELLTGTFRIVFLLRGGKIVRADEYHDRAMVESFMRLFAMQ